MATKKHKSDINYEVRGFLIIIGVACITLVIGFMCGLLTRIITQ
jgi:hypothetical protein